MQERTPPIPWLEPQTPFPPVQSTLGEGTGLEGLLAIGADLSPQRLMQAYRQGIFPWFSDGQPILWWCPDPRMVLQTQRFKVSRSLKKTLLRFLRTPGCEIRFDSAFEQVMRACANAPREGQRGTWITAEMQAAYTAWHRLGQVHSVETWVHGELVGGLYAVNIGRMVFGESMFAHRTDASKVALAALVAFCRAHDVAWIDCQQNTRHLASLGAAEVPRTAFCDHLKVATAALAPRWHYDAAHWIHLLESP